MREVPQAIRHVTVRACLRTCHYTIDDSIISDIKITDNRSYTNDITVPILSHLNETLIPSSAVVLARTEANYRYKGKGRS
jgi:hypothetical protein